MSGQRSASAPFSIMLIMRLERVIDNMWRKQKRLQQADFTTEELRQLFIPPAWRKSLSHSYLLQEGGPNGGQTLYASFLNTAPLRWNNPRIAFSFTFKDTSDGFLVPRQGWTANNPASILDDAPAELVQKFHDLVGHEVSASYQWGLVRHVLCQLNDPENACTTMAQVRYLWPCVLTLLRQANLGDIANGLQEVSMRAGDKAKAPRHVLECLKETYDIIAKIPLMKDLPLVDPIKSDVSYHLYSPTFDLGGSSFFGYY